MKEMYASAEYGIFGLILFFVLFIGIVYWLYAPGSKNRFQQYGQIPLEDDNDERR